MVLNAQKIITRLALQSFLAYFCLLFWCVCKISAYFKFFFFFQLQQAAVFCTKKNNPLYATCTTTPHEVGSYAEESGTSRS